MKMHRLLLALSAAALLAVLAVGATFAFTRGGDGNVSTSPGGDEPAPSRTPLHDARQDLAKRLNVDVKTIELLRVQHAGFDGCLGVYRPDAVCTMQYIGGYIAWYEVNGKEYRYHFGGSQFVAADFQPDGTRIDDGGEVEPMLQADLNGLLAEYARQDLALRLKAEAKNLVITGIVPGGFSSSCKGFEKPGQEVCTKDFIPGAVVFIEVNGKAYRYHVTVAGILATDFEDGKVTHDVDQDVLATQKKMREDLAQRTGKRVDQVSIVSFRSVTWPNGCLGVADPAAICLQALVPGFLAKLSDGEKEYRYHGTDDGHFIAASFAPDNAQIEEPIYGD